MDMQNRSENVGPDLACTRCRERKIRCGRERPHYGDEDDDDDDPSVSASLCSDDSTYLHVCRNQVDMADRYHGPSSLFVLCNHFRVRVLATCQPSAPLQSMLQNLCAVAGVTEPFPSYSDQAVTHLLPEQQATAAIDHFLQHLDCTTDIFVHSNLLANLKRVYSQQPKPGDDTWVICFKAITLLVLGTEISAQANSPLFGDFAHSFLPSRAALVNFHLLTTSRLINVQTLILLSVAAQQFDPPGWAELIFTQACMLARTMGLQHAQLLPDETDDVETLERAKVLRSLYTRDKSLFVTRGSISWLPSYDSNISFQLDAAVERRAPYFDRFRLAMLQDNIYCLTHAASRGKASTMTKSSAALQSIEQQMVEYARSFSIFDSETSYSPHRALIPLEFLATRILALRNGSKPRHAEQLQLDSRASCLLLLIAHGDQDHRVHEAFKSFVSRENMAANCPINEAMPPATRGYEIPFSGVLDAFPLPAFFILLDSVLQPTENETMVQPIPDLDLLQRVSACYAHNMSRMQSNSHHRKVSWIFSQLLTMVDLIKQAQHQPETAVSPTPPTDKRLSAPPPYLPPLHPQAVDFSNLPTSLPQGCPSNLASAPTPPVDTFVPWDNWLFAPAPMTPGTPFGTSSLANGLGAPAPAPDLLLQVLPSIQDQTDSSGQPMQWPAAPEPTPTSRKRMKTHEELDSSEDRPSPMSEFLASQEIPFHLIS
ncbi:hypothetical protein OIDMADRAFT_44459 [Oidiodendron maius Zn]|uniref:Transcription factor domain-containing protein n=1 Tax=Oidiodendron maius (strain Zn) TaxID=913774 RepID=A0A0C3GLM1_OIDMZ|nr:hypothetical protein OIDMADRAFT_44459 [Oidiodendron maius Zn]